MNLKSCGMSVLFFAVGVFFMWYAGMDLFERDFSAAYGVASALMLSIMAAQFWND